MMEFIDDEKLRKLYDKTIAKLNAKDKKDFKGAGALGPIPENFPEEKAWELYDLRKKLKEQYGIRKIKSLMKEEKLVRDTGEPFSCDANVRHKIANLNYFDDALRAGEQKWLPMLYPPKTAKQIDTGIKSHAGGETGLKVRFGTQKERAEEYQEYQEAINGLHERNRELSHTALCRAAASQFEVSFKTILRHTEHPSKKK